MGAILPWLVNWAWVARTLGGVERRARVTHPSTNGFLNGQIYQTPFFGPPNPNAAAYGEVTADLSRLPA
jgi:hypothetical protein